jgi:hypothetical protein
MLSFKVFFSFILTFSFLLISTSSSSNADVQAKINEKKICTQGTMVG